MSIHQPSQSRAAFLYSIGTSVPEHRLSQDTIRDFMIRTIRADLPPETRDEKIAFLNSIYDQCGISYRHSGIADYVRDHPEQYSFFSPTADLEPLPSTRERMEQYERICPELAASAANDALRKAGVPADAVTHLVFTSCTGHYAPGPEIHLIDRLGLSPSVNRLTVGFMGCYAAFNSLRTAAEIIRGQPDAIVLQICLELCTLHFQKDFTRNGIVSDCLFADGGAAAVLSGPSGPLESNPLLRVGQTHCYVDTEHREKMTWRIGDQGFRMYLDPDVPERIEPHLPSFVSTLLARNDLTEDRIDRWAVHPGGLEILERVGSALDLDRPQIQPSRRVFDAYGNMSSPTIYFVLHRLLNQQPLSAPACMLGFGPGLSLEGTILFPPDHA